MKRPSIKQLTLGGATVLGMIGFASPAAFAMSGSSYNNDGYASSHYSSYKMYNNHHKSRHCNTRHVKYYAKVQYSSYDKYHQHTLKCFHRIAHNNYY